MAKDKAPAFQFYPKDFLTDERVVLMSNTEIGIYIRLLCYCWLEGSLPLETEALAAFTRMPLKQFTRVWEVSIVRQCFGMGEDGRLHHKRLDGERQKQETYRRRASDGGKAALERRGAGGRFVRIADISTRVAGACEQKQAPAITSTPISDLQSPSPEKRKEPPPADSRSRHPAFKGQKLVVFDWMVEDLARMLEPHTEAFDLHEWFFTLDKRCVDRGEIAPERDGGAWLKTVTLAEAQRRGLPLRVAEAGGMSVAESIAAIDARQKRLAEAKAAGYR